MENKELNLVEILKDCPKGTRLYSPLFGEVIFDRIKNGYDYPIRVYHNFGEKSFTSKGQYLIEFTDGECMLFPSKENRDWSTFKAQK